MNFGDNSSEDEEPYTSSDEDWLLDDDDEDERLVPLLVQAFLWLCEATAVQNHYLSGDPHQPAPVYFFPGAVWVNGVLNADPVTCWDMFRMDSDTFCRLAYVLKGGNFWRLRARARIDVEESLAMFFIVVAQKFTHRLIRNQFRHSTEIIARHVRRMARVLCRLGRYIIKPKNNRDIHPRILQNPVYFPFFQDCIGAIDGTYVAAWAPADVIHLFRTRKGIVSQTVMAICDHSMRFIHICCGWEGSANDNRVLSTAIHMPGINYPHPPPGKYYVVDAAYTNMPGYLAPYRNARYHRTQFAPGNPPNNARELSNTRHSSVRMVIERTFGAWKRRFWFFRGFMDNYTIEHQVNMVMATATIHNFIIENASNDPTLDEVMDMYDPTAELTAEDDEPEIEVVGSSPEAMAAWAAFRDGLAQQIWESVHGPNV